MSFYLKLFSVFSFLLCSACATLDQEECLDADWGQIGFADGAKGLLADGRLNRHGKACSKHDIIPNEETYMLGHIEGVLDYCTPEQGLKLGRAGKEYNNVCPSGHAREFVAEYISGLSDELDDLAYDEDRAEEYVRERQIKYNVALATRTTDKERKDKRKKLESAKSSLRRVESDQRKIRRWISEWSRELADMT